VSVTQFMPNATIHLHRGDLPDGLSFGRTLAVDTETMGLRPQRDRLCLVQLSAGDGSAHLVQIVPERLGGTRGPDGADCPNLKALLSDPETVKLMHFARFDVSMRWASRWRRSAAPRSRRAWSAPSPTATGWRSSAASCSASI
jgi:ribonuclease D